MKTDMKNVLLGTVAAVSLAASGALAESHMSSDGSDMTEMQNASQMSSLNDSYADIADTEVAELMDMAVVTEDGERVGEVDNFVLMDQQLKAVVGVGGFLGLGEHDVALPLNELTYDGESLVISYTKEELEAMPEWTEEAEQQRLAESDTFNSYGSSEMAATGDEMENATDENAEMAATQLEEDPSDDTQAEEMAENAEGEIEQETEELAMEADNAADEAGEEIAGAAAATGAAIDAAADEAEQTAENAAEATENAAEEAGQEMAEAADATENAVEDAGEDVAQAADATGEAVENAADEAGQEMAEAANETENAVEEAGEDVAQAADAAEAEVEMAEAEAEAEIEGEAATEQVSVEGDTESLADGEGSTEMASTETSGDWQEKLGTTFAEIADMEISELEGTDVVSAEGETVGEVDDIGMIGDRLVAIVGVGGFLGLGEHDVALDFDQLGWNDGKFVAEGLTKESLNEMPEYEPENLEALDDDATLSTRMN